MNEEKKISSVPVEKIRVLLDNVSKTYFKEKVPAKIKNMKDKALYDLYNTLYKRLYKALNGGKNQKGGTVMTKNAEGNQVPDPGEQDPPPLIPPNCSGNTVDEEKENCYIGPISLTCLDTGDVVHAPAPSINKCFARSFICDWIRGKNRETVRDPLTNLAIARQNPNYIDTLRCNPPLPAPSNPFMEQLSLLGPHIPHYLPQVEAAFEHLVQILNAQQLNPFSDPLGLIQVVTAGLVVYIVRNLNNPRLVELFYTLFPHPPEIFGGRRRRRKRKKRTKRRRTKHKRTKNKEQKHKRTKRRRTKNKEQKHKRTKRRRTKRRVRKYSRQ